MNIRSKIKSFFEKIKNIYDAEVAYHKLLKRDVINFSEADFLDLPALSSYETRRKELLESDEPIQGIFYIYNGKIIPDYYSECLISDKENNLRNQMCHSLFYINYMFRKFEGLDYSEKSLPRGRIGLLVELPGILIDKCFIDDKNIIAELIKLYRLPVNIRVTNLDYRCPACKGSDDID